MNRLSRLSPSAFRYQMGGAAMVAVAAAALLSILMLAGGMATGEYSVVYASMALLAFLMPAAAGLLRGRDYDLFEPINLVAGAILYATTLRAFYLIGSSSSVVEFNMWGTNFEAVVQDVPWMLFGVAALVVGYLAFPVRLSLERLGFVRGFALNRRWLAISIGLATVAGLIGTVLFMRQFGIDLSGNILAQSTKRVVEFEGEGGEIIYGLGLAGVFGRWAQFGFLLLGSVLLARLLPVRLQTLVLLVALFILSALVPFFASSRSSILLMLISLCIVAYYYQRIRLRTIIIVVVAGVGIVSGMGYLRQMNQTGRVTHESVLDSTLGAGNGIDFVRTSAIMDRVPEVRGYQNGRTYLALFSSVIPRSVWPNKPEASLGAYVKGELFGQRVRKAGWPPGMIAEAHMNFGTAGILPVMFIFGALLRLFYETCRPLLGVSFLVTVFYSVAVWRLAFGTIGLNFVLGLTQTLQLAVPMLFFLWLAKAPRLRRGNPLAGARPGGASLAEG
ncbi:MAG TPA: O-antigen polysaccharide polymerase Wzy [Allosphingosinicella sp.]|nr:O-antigen polysaccharide polymerase Wzy [Allosphingosinicella sp.]